LHLILLKEMKLLRTVLLIRLNGKKVYAHCAYKDKEAKTKTQIANSKLRIKKQSAIRNPQSECVD
jgi:hypothetical protein